MSSLTGNLIANSYLGLLKTVDNTAITATPKNVTDGGGNATALSLSNDQIVVTGSVDVTGSLIIKSPTGGTFSLMNDMSYVTTDSNQIVGTYIDMHGINLYSGSNFLDITVNGEAFLDYTPGSLIAVADNTGNPHPIIKFQNFNNWTNGNIDVTVPMTTHSGSSMSGSVSLSGSLTLSPSSSFVLPTIQPQSPIQGTAFYSGSYLYIYTGTKFVSASLA